jgi:hypothetical protein
MNETKWTQGPWSTNWQDNGTEVFGADGYWLMSMKRITEELKANARLIAAAPELYEALEECKRVLSDLQSTQLEGTRTRAAWEKARAALAKARGE